MDFNNEIMNQLKDISSLNRDQMTDLLKSNLTEKEFSAIQAGGVAGAAFVTDVIDWKIASEVSGKTFPEMISELKANKAFTNVLSHAQKYVLDTYYRINRSAQDLPNK